jgi:thiol-disulfide isomerase/thioredoxin
VKSSLAEKTDKIVMVVVGLVLIIAAALKIHQLLTEPIISEGFWESWEFFVIQIPLELGLGIWLICGLFRKAGWLLAVSAFVVFIASTSHRVLIGAESCGCFGVVKVNPWITLFAIDVPFLIALLLFRPRGQKILPPPWPSAKHFFGVAIPTFILLGAVVLVLISNRVTREEVWTENEPVARSQTSEESAKREWSMLKYIDIADSLRSNIAVVVFYSNECDTCHEAIPLYDKMSRDMADNEDVILFAFIEVPPYAEEGYDIVPTDTPCLRGKLSSVRLWNIITPLVVVTRDGLMVKSWEGQAPKLDEILEAALTNS